MAKVIGFTELPKHFPGKSVAGTNRYCLTDTNFVVSFLHDEHTFWSDSRKFFSAAADADFRFFVTHTSRSEFLDVERKFSLTRPLVELYREEGKWKGKIKEESRKLMKDSVQRITTSKNGFDYFSDRDLKEIKETFFAFSESGKVGWINFCDEFLSKELSAAWEKIIGDIGLNYLNIRNEEAELAKPECLLNRKVEWENLISLVGRTGMGTSDAMIANVFLSSKFDVLVTTDLDMAYGLSVDKDDSKIVAIPDNMVQNNKDLFKKISKKR